MKQEYIIVNKAENVFAEKMLEVGVAFYSEEEALKYVADNNIDTDRYYVKKAETFTDDWKCDICDKRTCSCGKTDSERGVIYAGDMIGIINENK